LSVSKIIRCRPRRKQPTRIRQRTWLVPGWTSVRDLAKPMHRSLVSPSKKLHGKREGWMRGKARGIRCPAR
jgi:hypothetical protein